MPRVVLKRVSKYFDALQCTLIVYFHDELSLTEVCERVTKRLPCLKNYDISADEGDGAVTVTVNDQRTAYLLINKRITVGILHHESIHITTHSFSLTGSSHSDETDELYAYHSQLVFEFLLQTVMEKFKVPKEDLLVF